MMATSHRYLIVGFDVFHLKQIIYEKQNTEKFRKWSWSAKLPFQATVGVYRESKALALFKYLFKLVYVVSKRWKLTKTLLIFLEYVIR